MKMKSLVLLPTVVLLTAQSTYAQDNTTTLTKDTVTETTTQKSDEVATSSKELAIIEETTQRVGNAFRSRVLRATTQWEDSDFVIEGTTLKRLSRKGIAKYEAGNHNIVINNNNITQIGYVTNIPLGATDATIEIHSTSLKQIGEHAFSGAQFNRIALNTPNLTEIGEYAFYTNRATTIVFNAPKLNRINRHAFFGHMANVKGLQDLDFSNTGLSFVGKETFTDTDLITMVPIKVNDLIIAIENASFGQRGQVSGGSIWDFLGGNRTSTDPYVPIFFAPVNSSVIKPYAQTVYQAGVTSAKASELKKLQAYQLIRPYTVEFRFWEEKQDGTLVPIFDNSQSEQEYALIKALLLSNQTLKPVNYDSVRTDKDGRLPDANVNSYTNQRGIFTLIDFDPSTFKREDFPLRRKKSPNSFDTPYYPISQEEFDAAYAKLNTALANVKAIGEQYHYVQPTIEGYDIVRVRDVKEEADGVLDSNVGTFNAKPLRIDFVYRAVLNATSTTTTTTQSERTETSSVETETTEISTETTVIPETTTTVPETEMTMMQSSQTNDTSTSQSMSHSTTTVKVKQNKLPKTNSSQFIFAMTSGVTSLLLALLVFIKKSEHK